MNARAGRTVLFDLDGTLADTAPDLTAALNRVRAEQGLPALPLADVRPIVSLGGRAMVKLAFGLAPSDPQFDDVHRRFLAHYGANVAERTQLFPGMAGVLDHLEDQGVRWGVVTNKVGRLTLPLLARLGLERRAACIVCGDTTANRKPHPEPLLFACSRVGSEPARCIYVGDASNDIAAGRSAGMRTLVALFGYIPPGVDPLGWGADGTLDEPAGLLPWMADH